MGSGPPLLRPMIPVAIILEGVDIEQLECAAGGSRETGIPRAAPELIGVGLGCGSALRVDLKKIHPPVSIDRDDPVPGLIAGGEGANHITAAHCQIGGVGDGRDHGHFIYTLPLPGGSNRLTGQSQAGEDQKRGDRRTKEAGAAARPGFGLFHGMRADQCSMTHIG